MHNERLSGIKYMPLFLLSVLNQSGQVLAGFLSRFCRGWSILSTCRHRKRAADFCAKIAAPVQILFYIDDCFLLAFVAVQEEVFKHRIGVCLNSGLVAADLT